MAWGDVVEWYYRTSYSVQSHALLGQTRILLGPLSVSNLQLSPLPCPGSDSISTAVSRNVASVALASRRKIGVAKGVDRFKLLHLFEPPSQFYTHQLLHITFKEPPRTITILSGQTSGE